MFRNLLLMTMSKLTEQLFQAKVAVFSFTY